jgi:predicted amidohydrolase
MIRSMRAAAIQLAATPADVDANLAACERLAGEAAARGAELIVLPEFFTTGMGFLPELADAALPPDGDATALLRMLALRHRATVGGSFLCRDDDGHVRNAFKLVTPDGAIAGRHDKDLPTMWENAFYVGGHDDGVIEASGTRYGVALCWELMRTQTVQRLRGRVDAVVGGSAWWSMPTWPGVSTIERRNEAAARHAAESFATFVGAPVVHAAHCGELDCAMPWSPARFRGWLEGSACIVAADGTVLARRDRRDGEGVVVADLEPGAVAPAAEPPGRFWLHRRQVLSALVWNQQRLHGRRWYRRHVQREPQAALRADRVAA